MRATQPSSKPPHLAGGQPAAHEDFLLARRHRLAQPWLQAGGGYLLDLGCGNGAQTLHFAPAFDFTVGIDVQPAFLRALLQSTSIRSLRSRFLALCYGGFGFPLRDASIDVAISFEVLEHVADEALTLQELHRVLRPGGLLVLSVPNRWWIFETHGAALPLLPWNRVPFFSWLPKRIHDRFARARIYRRREIVQKLQATGFSIQDSCYVTAPMDALRWQPLQTLLRATVFRPDSSPWPCLATSVLVIARRPGSTQNARVASASGRHEPAPTATL